MALLPVEEALRRLLADAGPVGAETVALADAAGRVLAEPVEALRTQPPFPASAMDGYAVRAARPRRRPKACGDRRSAGRRAVRRPGRRRPGRAHLHRRAGAGRGRHDPHPGECAAHRRGNGRGRRDGRRRPPHPPCRAGFRRRRNAARAAVACSMRRRCRWRPRPTTRRCRSFGGRWSPSSPPATNCCRPAACPAPARSLPPTPMASPRSRVHAGADVIDLGIVRDRRDEMSARIGEALDARADIIVTLGGRLGRRPRPGQRSADGQGHAARFLEDRDAPGQAADVRPARRARG